MKKQRMMLVVMAVSALVLAVIAVIVLRFAFVGKEYQHQLSLGDKYLKELDYANAELCYTDAIDINEKPVKPYIQLSNVYSAQKEFDKAYDILEKAQEVNEKYNENRNMELIEAQIKYLDNEVQNTAKKNKQKQQAVVEPEESKPVESPQVEAETTYLADYLKMTLAQIWETYGKECVYGDELYYGGIRPIYYEDSPGIPLFGIDDREKRDPAAYSGDEPIIYLDFLNTSAGENSKWPVAEGLMSDMTYQELLGYDPNLTVVMHSDVNAMACFFSIQYGGKTCVITYFWPVDTDYNTAGAERVELMIPYGERSAQTSAQTPGDYYAHLQEVENEAERILNSGQDTTASINDACGQVYNLWDNELNYVYQELKKTLSESEFQMLRQEELDWINYRDAEAEAATAEYRSPDGSVGTASTAAYIIRKTDITKERVYELAKRWIG